MSGGTPLNSAEAQDAASSHGNKDKKLPFEEQHIAVVEGYGSSDRLQQKILSIISLVAFFHKFV